MEVTFIYTRKSGQRVLVEGRVKFIFRCDCRPGESHPHVDDFYLDAVTDVDTEDKVILDGKELLEVEDEAIDIAYDEVA